MRKILTLAVVALMLCGTASAQVEVSAEIGYGLHDGGLGYDTYELDVAGAYRIGKHFSIGAGTGIGNIDIPLRKGKIYVQVGYTTRKLKTKVYLPGTQYGPGADFYEHGHHDMFDFSLGYTVRF